MRDKFSERERHRQNLISRAGVQRDRLALLYRRIRKPATFAKTAAGTFQAFRGFKSHPKLATSFAALLVGTFRPRVAKIALPLGIAVWSLRPLKKWWSKRHQH